MHKLKILFIALLAVVAAQAADPTETNYTWTECQGSLRPYPDIKARVETPDSLTAVYINHVGRHGARFPASPNHTMELLKLLNDASERGTITPAGKKLMQLTELVVTMSQGRWGALDSLGMAEHRGIASRMYQAFSNVFKGRSVEAISSYSPRCMMSMYEFTHQLDRLDNHIEFTTTTGRKNSPLMRPFDTVQDYIDWRKTDAWAIPYDIYFAQICPTAPIERMVGKNYPWESDEQKQEKALIEYYVLAGMSAMGIDCDADQFYTSDERNALWSIFNLRQYLQRTATTISTIPADIATDLLSDIIETTDRAVKGQGPAANLRFGHAETLMPLLSLMRLPGCYYMTNYFDTVRQHWCDFYVVPMAANLQIILFKNNKNGVYYVRCDLNEKPIALIPNTNDIYVPWTQARQYLLRCLPLHMQI